jgi:hypothetical protein
MATIPKNRNQKNTQTPTGIMISTKKPLHPLHPLGERQSSKAYLSLSDDEFLD